jgi:spore maturation protein CgeB
MKPIFEISKFPDGRLMVRVRFYTHSNFWIHDLESATWVPTIEDVATLKEVIDVTNEHNEIKKALKFNRRD